MRRRTAQTLAALKVALLLNAAGLWSGAWGQAAYTLRAEREPFAYAVVARGEAVMAQQRGNVSSLFFETDEGVQHLTRALSFVVSDTSLIATYETTDGRRAMVTIEPQPHGGPRLALRLSPDEGILGVGETLVARPGEHIHGLSERVRGNHDEVPRDPGLPVALDRRGHRVEMNLNGTISLYAPFYLSSAGYGLFAEGTWTGVFDVAATDPGAIRFRFDGPGLAYHVFTGGTPARILEQYTGVVGRTLQPPTWAFGHFRWRDDHTHRDTLYDGTPYRGPFNSEVYEDVTMLEALGIPLSVYWVDRPWAVGGYGYDDFTWDPDRFPNARAMMRWLEDRGLKFLVWIAPWVMGEAATEALEMGYFLPSKRMVELGLRRAEQAKDVVFLRSLKPALKAHLEELSDRALARLARRYARLDVQASDAGAVAEARQALLREVDGAETSSALRRLLILPDEGLALVDFTHPKAVAWWQGYIRAMVEDGVDAFKLDRAEELVPGDRDVFAYDGRSLAEVRNVYPVLYAKAVYKAAAPVREGDILVMPRAGYPGAQQVAVFWAGDTRATWLGFRNAYLGGLRAGLMGYPLWGSDTGGYWGGTTTHELLARWLALSAFSPILEVGPTGNRGPWDMPDGTGYNAEAIAAYRLYVLLHEHLRPYIERYADEAARTGHPIMRPLFFHHPEDEAAWRIWDQYLFGEDYLVAPVLEEGATERAVYLPKGEWVDYWNPDVRHTGPATVTVETPLYKTPIFLRAGSTEEILDLERIYQASLDRAQTPPVLSDGSEIEIDE